MFIYNTDDKQLIRGVDLKAIGCDKTQGDEACEISVNKDGTEVYLHKIMSDKLYVYHVIENVITEEKYELNNDDLFVDILGAHSGKMISYNGDTGMRTISLVNDTQIGELGYTYDELSSFRNSYNDYFGTKDIKENSEDREYDTRKRGGISLIFMILGLILTEYLPVIIASLAGLFFLAISK